MKPTDKLSRPALPTAAPTARGNEAVLRPFLASALLVLAFAASPAGAVEEHHPQAGAGSMPPASANATQETDTTVEKMQENVRRMQSQLERVASAKTDEERRAALADHMRTMQAVTSHRNPATDFRRNPASGRGADEHLGGAQGWLGFAGTATERFDEVGAIFGAR